ncbi:hypothetical protein B0T17DRAFT_511673 [Bombardia bombarda]|uniref:Uncharacterized protein n=1 Tax=Bombardia bombarda TaxID=252184 RepID=A0AA39U5Z5_9PEZI|nr:hypothetical protein B0T17DRAFT_511673 [Bombardia bombarda]
MAEEGWWSVRAQGPRNGPGGPPSQASDAKQTPPSTQCRGALQRTNKRQAVSDAPKSLHNPSIRQPVAICFQRMASSQLRPLIRAHCAGQFEPLERRLPVAQILGSLWGHNKPLRSTLATVLLASTAVAALHLSIVSRQPSSLQQMQQMELVRHLLTVTRV